MKKILILAALSLAAAGSWAFFPKAAEPSGYMMVIGRVYTGYSIIVVNPTSETVTKVIDPKNYGTPYKSDLADTELRKAEISKINELKQEGWKVVSMSVHSSQSLVYREDVYLLEK